MCVLSILHQYTKTWDMKVWRRIQDGKSEQPRCDSLLCRHVTSPAAVNTGNKQCRDSVACGDVDKAARSGPVQTTFTWSTHAGPCVCARARGVESGPEKGSGGRHRLIRVPVAQSKTTGWKGIEMMEGSVASWGAETYSLCLEVFCRELILLLRPGLHCSL